MSPAAPGPASAPQRKSRSTGCLIATIVVLALVGGGAYFGYRAVRDRVDDTLSESGGPGIGNFGDCARFQASFMFMTMSSIMTMGSDQLESQLGEMRSIAPGAVREDVEVISDALGDAMARGLVGATSLGDGGGQTPEQQAAAEADVEAILSSPEVERATRNIGVWAEENCGAESSPGGFFPSLGQVSVP